MLVCGEEIKRGQIWYVSFNDALGSEEAVGRPAVIVTSDMGLSSETTVLNMVYMTRTPKKNSVSVELSKHAPKSWALCNQIVTVDTRRFLKKMGEVPPEDMLKIEVGLRTVLGLPVGDKNANSELLGLQETLGLSEKKIKDLELELAVQKSCMTEPYIKLPTCDLKKTRVR